MTRSPLRRRPFITCPGVRKGSMVRFCSSALPLVAAALFLLPAVSPAGQSCSCSNVGGSLPPWATAKPKNGCPAEGPDPLHHLAARANATAASAPSGHPDCDLTYGDLIAAINSKSKNLQIIDVRQPDEVEETGMMPGAVNLPLDELEKALGMSSESFAKLYGLEKPVPPGTGIIFSCRRGRRSRMALEIAHKAGYSQSKHYIGGWDEYAAKQEESVQKGG